MHVRHRGFRNSLEQSIEPIRRQLFGDRFQAGYGLKDPAYMPLTPHESAEWLFGMKSWDRYHSAGELKAYINAAPGWEQLGRDDRGERWYDDSARLAAKWILGRLRAEPSEARLVATFWPTMESAFPHIVTMSLSSAQRQWVKAAALRIFDAYRYDGVLDFPA